MNKFSSFIVMSFIFLASCSGVENITYQTIGEIERLDPQISKLVPEDAKIEILADGFGWSEGPVWVMDGQYLLFNDIPANTLYKWTEKEGLSVYLRPAGISSGGDPKFQQFGCNGLFINPVNNRLILCEHGNRCLSQLDDKLWMKTVVVDQYEGKKFNSPNDVVISSKGHFYFTDPPYGLKRVDGSVDKNPLKELDYSGVYHHSPDNTTTLITKELDRPNGIILSPDEKTLYVANSSDRAIWLAFDVAENGSTSNSRIFFDASDLRKSGKKGGCDGMAVDTEGNIWATGPGGVLIISPEGKHLGTVHTGESIANCCFGGINGDYLYMTSHMYLCRVKVTVKGNGY